MPKDLKLFLMACVAVPLLLITFLVVNFFSNRPNDIVTDLELNRFKMNITMLNARLMTAYRRMRRAVIMLFPRIELRWRGGGQTCPSSFLRCLGKFGG